MKNKARLMFISVIIFKVTLIIIPIFFINKGCNYISNDGKRTYSEGIGSIVKEIEQDFKKGYAK